MKTLSELKEEKRVRDEIKSVQNKKDKELAEIRLTKWRETELDKLPAYIDKEILPKIIQAVDNKESNISIYSHLSDTVLNEYVSKILNAAGYNTKLRIEWCREEYDSDLGYTVGGNSVHYLDIKL